MSIQRTAFGPVYVRDGILAFVNPALTTANPDADVSMPYVKACAWFDACRMGEAATCNTASALSIDRADTLNGRELEYDAD